MITLQDDQLLFSFPSIVSELRRLVEDYVQRTLPRILAEDRQQALHSLRRRYGSCRATTEQRERAERELLDAPPARIEMALHKRSMSVAGLDPAVGRAALTVQFQRTLRIPDDGEVYPLPAGLGAFPLRHVDDFAATTPESWRQRGGVLMPMYQSEALWIDFHAPYPCALKIAAGKINAVTGEPWSAGLHAEPQDYVVLPEQPWLDGFAVQKGVIRQFVAMPLGDGYSVEEQLTGKADVGGMQLQAHPLKPAIYFKSELQRRLPKTLEELLITLLGDCFKEEVLYQRCMSAPACGSMGLGMGGQMRQEIYRDRRALSDWDQEQTSRCFVHLCNSLVWREITGGAPPQPPLTSREYGRAGRPWFDYYRDDLAAVPGADRLAQAKSIATLGAEKGIAPLPENASITPGLTIQYGNARRPDEVREWADA